LTLFRQTGFLQKRFSAETLGNRSRAVSLERAFLEIRFLVVAGYRTELPEEKLSAAFNEDHILELSPALVGPSITHNAGIIGQGVDLTIDRLEKVRPATLLYHLTRRLMETKFRDPGEEIKLFLFGQLKAITCAKTSARDMDKLP
jgi:type III restriction enzyme